MSEIIFMLQLTIWLFCYWLKRIILSNAPKLSLCVILIRNYEYSPLINFISIMSCNWYNQQIYHEYYCFVRPPRSQTLSILIPKWTHLFHSLSAQLWVITDAVWKWYKNVQLTAMLISCDRLVDNYKGPPSTTYLLKIICTSRRIAGWSSKLKDQLLELWN